MFGRIRISAVTVSRIVLALSLAGSPIMENQLARAAESPSEIAIDAARDLVAEKFGLIVDRMDSRMAAGLPAPKLGELWGSLTRQFGPCGSLGDVSSEPKDGFTIVRVPLNFRVETLDLKFTVASDRIVGFFIAPHEAPHSVWTAPSYADPGAFRDVEVRIGREPEALPGTLSLPVDAEQAPAVVLVQGSGPQDRDESLGPNRPFRDLAEGLASRGVAVLRYDKRTKVYPGAFVGLKNPTVKDEVLDDVALAIAFLQTRSEIDPQRIVVIGHSLGGTLAPRIAASNPAIAKIVILAGATRSLPDIAVEQVEYLASLNGPPDETTSKSIEALKADAARARAARPGDVGAPFFGAPLSYWADLNAHDPAKDAAELTIPMLILQGGRDYQVSDKDFERFQSALRDHANVECRWLPALNHQFMAGVGRSTPEEYRQPGHFDAEVVSLIADFLMAR